MPWMQFSFYNFWNKYFSIIRYEEIIIAGKERIMDLRKKFKMSYKNNWWEKLEKKLFSFFKYPCFQACKKQTL